jgi:hypothetical protein
MNCMGDFGRKPKVKIKIKKKQPRQEQKMALSVSRDRLNNREPGMIRPVKEKRSEETCYYSDDIVIPSEKQVKSPLFSPVSVVQQAIPKKKNNKSVLSSSPALISSKPAVKKRPGFFAKLFGFGKKKVKENPVQKMFDKAVKAKKVKKKKGMAGCYCMGDF